MKKKWLILYTTLHFTFLISNVHPDLIQSYQIVNKNKIIVKANREFSKQFINKDFFVEYDKSIDLTTLDESIVTIPFILSIIPIVWVCNKSYAIEVMDKDLYHSLQEVKKVFRIFYPEQKWAGELIPKKLVDNTIVPSSNSDEPQLGLLFSGGLDSVDSSMTHIDTKQLLITVWGSDIPLHKTKMWAGAYQKCDQFTHTYGHVHTFVKSNFRQFVEERRKGPKILSRKLNVSHLWRMFTLQALGYAGITAPILATYNIPKLLIASSHTLEDPTPFGSHPALDDNIAFLGSTVFHDGAEKDRVQKVMNINAVCKEKNLPLPQLRVCWNKHPLGENCLKCGVKCLLTAFNIMAANQLPKEYGLNISLSEAIERARLFFKKSKNLRKGFLINWECDLLYLDKLSKETFSNQEIKSLQKFFYSIDFEGLLDHNAFTYSPKKNETICIIVDGPFKRNV